MPTFNKKSRPLLKQNRKKKKIDFHVILILRSEEYMVKNIKGGYIIKKSKVLIKKKGCFKSSQILWVKEGV